jgi:hypothetical protein
MRMETPIVIVLLMLWTSTFVVIVVDCTCTCAFRAPILETLYHAANGTGWLQPWDLTSLEAPCSWKGVTCDNGDVVILNLGSRGLSGSVPKEITNLTNLEKLYLSFNQLEGTIHSEYRLLSKLTTLDLRQNRFTGTLPAEFGTAWSATSFAEFDVSFNCLNGTLPTSYSNWVNLKYYTVSGNLLTGTLPVEYQSFRHLNDLRVADNQLIGTIPAEYGNWTAMETFYVFNNSFNGTIPSSFEKWGPTLWRFYAFSNRLTGTLPNEFGAAWTGVTEFVVNQNSLSGTLPPGYSNWRKMQQFEVQGNILSGTIPAQYAAWSGLALVDLSNNQLTGPIPHSWSGSGDDGGGGGGLVNATRMFLQGNQLTGTIPTRLLELPLLQTFVASYNQLSGTIPPQSSLALSSFSIQNNTELAGTLPKQLTSSNNPLRVVAICGSRVTCPVSSLLLVCLPRTFAFQSGIDTFVTALGYTTQCNISDIATPAPRPQVTMSLAPLRQVAEAPQSKIVARRSSTAMAYSAVVSGAGGGGSARGAIPSLQRSSSLLRLAALCSAATASTDDNGRDGGGSGHSDIDINGAAFGNAGDNPLMLSISPPTIDPSLAYAAGAAIGNAVLVVGVGVIAHTLCVAHMRLVAMKHRATATSSSSVCGGIGVLVRSALGTLICMLPCSLLPGALFVTYGTLSVPAVGACVALIVSSSRTSASVASGALMLLLWIGLPLYCAAELLVWGRQRSSTSLTRRSVGSTSAASVFLLETVRVSKSTIKDINLGGASSTTVNDIAGQQQQQQRRRKRPHSKATTAWHQHLRAVFADVLRTLLHPTVEWRRNASVTRRPSHRRRADFLLEHLEPVFGPYVLHREWFFLVECFFSWVSGAVMGLAEMIASDSDDGATTSSSSAACEARDWATYCAMILCALYAACCIWLRPFSIRFDGVIAVMLQSIGILVGGLVLSNHIVAAEVVASAAALLEIIVMVLMKLYDGFVVLDGKQKHYSPPRTDEGVSLDASTIIASTTTKTQEEHNNPHAAVALGEHTSSSLDRQQQTAPASTADVAMHLCQIVEAICSRPQHSDNNTSR